MSVGIVTSAAPVNAEMSAEFGALPPAFLPVGNKRLFCHQVALLRRLVERVVLTLPQSFTIPPHDAGLLNSLDVEVVRIPDGLSLPQSVMLAVIQSIGGDEPLVILHGDTLFLELEHFPPDGLSVHAQKHPYPWAVVANDAPLTLALSQGEEDSGLVSGLFCFSHGLGFLKCLAMPGADFLSSINSYARQYPAFEAVAGAGVWLDFGHLHTFYDSRRALTTQRAFNSITMERDVVSKSSGQQDKMAAEAAWFEMLPPPLRSYVPAYLGPIADGPLICGYRLAYEYLCPLSDLFVFGALPLKSWRRILESCADVLSRFRQYCSDSVLPAGALYGDKAARRFEDFARQSGVNPETEWRLNGQNLPSPLRMIEEMAAIIGCPRPDETALMHGDFCLSNILFDFRRGGIKLVDPRGFVEEGRPSLMGDVRYDAGKLHHSLAGRYDMILARYFELRRETDGALLFEVAPASEQGAIEQLYAEIICGGDPDRLKVMAAISVLLFLSMLPLHAEDEQRQWALLANAGRLYAQEFAA